MQIGVHMNIPAQIIGICGTVSLFVMYRQQEKKKYIGLKLLSDVLWALHYFLLSAVGGAIPNMVGIARELVFMNDGKKWADKKVWAAVFIIINAAFALSVIKSAIQFIPIIASALVTVSLTFKNTANIRLMTIPISTAFLVYDIMVGSWAGALNEVISLISMVSKSVSEHRG